FVAPRPAWLARHNGIAASGESFRKNRNCRSVIDEPGSASASVSVGIADQALCESTCLARVLRGEENRPGERRISEKPGSATGSDDNALERGWRQLIPLHIAG